MKQMFKNTNIELNISKWETNNVTDMTEMFDNNNIFNQNWTVIKDNYFRFCCDNIDIIYF